MREYSRIYPSFWTGKTGKLIRLQGKDEVIVSIYLLTSPHANMIGLYYIPIQYISYETGISTEGATKALLSLSKIGFSYYDIDTEFVWIPMMAIYQIGKSLKPKDKQVKGIINVYGSIPNNPFLYDFYEIHKDRFHILNPRGEKGASKGLERSIEARIRQGKDKARYAIQE